MGITGLLPFLKELNVTFHLTLEELCEYISNLSQDRKDFCLNYDISSPQPQNCKFASQKEIVAAIDAHSWLHKAACGCAEQLYNGDKENMENARKIYVGYFIKYIELLQEHGITPILVFDGCSPPLKTKYTNSARKSKKEEARKRAEHYIKHKDWTKARPFLIASVDITFAMIQDVIKECRERGVKYIVAPYEADAQMTYLQLNNYVDFVITEDSDLVVFGCERILFKLDVNGCGTFYDKKRLMETFCKRNISSYKSIASSECLSELVVKEKDDNSMESPDATLQVRKTLRNLRSTSAVFQFYSDFSSPAPHLIRRRNSVNENITHNNHSDLSSPQNMVTSPNSPFATTSPIGNSLPNFDFVKFQYMCILSGCDYLPSIPGIGLQKARKFMSLPLQCRDMRRLIPKIPIYLKQSSLRLPPSYVADFIDAHQLFLYQVVYDPSVQSFKPLTTTLSALQKNICPENHMSTEQFLALLRDYSATMLDHRIVDRLQILCPLYRFDNVLGTGDYGRNELAHKIAIGKIDPNTININTNVDVCPNSGNDTELNVNGESQSTISTPDGLEDTILCNSSLPRNDLNDVNLISGPSSPNLNGGAVDFHACIFQQMSTLILLSHSKTTKSDNTYMSSKCEEKKFSQNGLPSPTLPSSLDSGIVIDLTSNPNSPMKAPSPAHEKSYQTITLKNSKYFSNTTSQHLYKINNGNNNYDKPDENKENISPLNDDAMPFSNCTSKSSVGNLINMGKPAEISEDEEFYSLENSTNSFPDNLVCSTQEESQIIDLSSLNTPKTRYNNNINNNNYPNGNNLGHEINMGTNNKGKLPLQITPSSGTLKTPEDNFKRLPATFRPAMQSTPTNPSAQKRFVKTEKGKSKGFAKLKNTPSVATSLNLDRFKFIRGPKQNEFFIDSHKKSLESRELTSTVAPQSLTHINNIQASIVELYKPKKSSDEKKEEDLKLLKNKELTCSTKMTTPKKLRKSQTVESCEKLSPRFNSTPLNEILNKNNIFVTSFKESSPHNTSSIANTIRSRLSKFQFHSSGK